MAIKYQRRFPGFDEKIVSMYARGMTTREIQGSSNGDLRARRRSRLGVLKSPQGACNRRACGPSLERRAAKRS